MSCLAIKAHSFDIEFCHVGIEVMDQNLRLQNELTVQCPHSLQAFATLNLVTLLDFAFTVH